LVDSPYQNTSLPIGLSFYTFQSISYLVDIYRKKDDRKYSFVETATFIAFFPKLLAGPLERVESFILELNKRHSYNGKRIFTAFKIIIYALVCKFVLADKIGFYVDGSLSDYRSLSSINILTTAALFSFQIFFDFYAYSILAIGIAKLYGIKLSYNFNYPYFRSSLYDFWKRWNITLTSWFRDYIYIPLGGSRVTTMRWAVNVLIVFVISGIWHGATLNFLLWGFLHGLFYSTERYVYKYLPDSYRKNSLLKVLYACTVFILLSLLWLIFRVDSFPVLSQLFGRLFSAFSWDVNRSMIIWFVLITLLMQFFRKYQIAEKYIFMTKDDSIFILKEICLINSLIILLLFLSESGNSSFIYFEF
jgi:D-alanyl-lipoteichoic acid acyltransferase DltB (MBOAT superfamily)